MRVTRSAFVACVPGSHWLAGTEPAPVEYRPRLGEGKIVAVENCRDGRFETEAPSSARLSAQLAALGAYCLEAGRERLNDWTLDS